MLLWSREAFVSALALSLLHSLWQGALIGGIALLLNTRLKRATPDLRCSVFYVLLLTFGIGCLGTFLDLYLQAARLSPLPSGVLMRETYFELSSSSHALTSASRIGVLPTLAPWLVVAWAAGVCTLSLRHLGGLLLLHRWCRTESVPCLPVWEACAQRLAQQMSIGRKILLRCSAQIDVPFAFGLFKSYVLLPSSVLLGLTPEQTEALIAHELAHIARYDVLFNLVQVCTETILFYHPVVWWLSAQIRVAREQRCDDLAVQVIGDRALYARALYSLEEARAALPHLALGAKGDPTRMTNRHLIHRIQRVLGVSGPEKRDPWAKGALALCGAAIGLATLIPLRAYSRPIQQTPPAKSTRVVQVSTNILLNINGDKIELHTTDLKPDTIVKVNGKEGRYGDLTPLQQKQLAEAIQKVHVGVDTDLRLNINGDQIELHTTDLTPDTIVKVNGKEGRYGDLTPLQQKQLAEAVQNASAKSILHRVLVSHSGAGDVKTLSLDRVGTTVLLNINGDKIELHTTDLKPDTLVKVNGKEGRFGDLTPLQQKQLAEALSAADVKALQHRVDIKLEDHAGGVVAKVVAGGGPRILVSVNGSPVEIIATAPGDLDTANLPPDTIIKMDGKESKYKDLTPKQQQQIRDTHAKIHIVAPPDDEDIDTTLDGLDLPDDVKQDVIVKVKQAQENPPAKKDPSGKP